MHDFEMSLEHQLDEIADEFEGTAAYGVTRQLLETDLDLSALSTRQKNVWDWVIWPALGRAQKRRERLFAQYLLERD